MVKIPMPKKPAKTEKVEKPPARKPVKAPKI
jgi:hypothetical protein